MRLVVVALVSVSCSPLMPIQRDAGPSSPDASVTAGGSTAGGGAEAGGGTAGGGGQVPSWSKERLDVPMTLTGAVKLAANGGHVFALAGNQYALSKNPTFQTIGSFGTPVFRDVAVNTSGHVVVSFGSMVGGCFSGCATALSFDEFPLPRAVLCETNSTLTAMMSARDGGFGRHDGLADGTWPMREQHPVDVVGCARHLDEVVIAAPGLLGGFADAGVVDTSSVGRPGATEPWFAVVFDRTTARPVAVSRSGALARRFGTWRVDDIGESGIIAVAAASFDDVWVLTQTKVRRLDRGTWVDIALPSNVIPSDLAIDGTAVYLGGSETNVPVVYSRQR